MKKIKRSRFPSLFLNCKLAPGQSWYPTSSLILSFLAVRLTDCAIRSFRQRSLILHYKIASWRQGIICAARLPAAICIRLRLEFYDAYSKVTIYTDATLLQKAYYGLGMRAQFLILNKPLQVLEIVACCSSNPTLEWPTNESCCNFQKTAQL